MPLDYGYEYEVRRLRIQIAKLNLFLMRHPEDAKALNKKKELQQEISWFTQKIQEGKDPGLVVR